MKPSQRLSILYALVLLLNLAPFQVVMAQEEEEDVEISDEIEASEEDQAEASDADSADEFDEGSEDFADEEGSSDEGGFEETEEVQAEAPGEELEPIESTETPPAMAETPEATPEPAVEEPVAEDPPAPVELQAEEPAAPAAPLEVAADDPDLNYEAKLHDIFVQFYNAKTPNAEWDALVGSRNAERYRIQNGDNLWSVSKTIFGDGHYWPKVWSLNSEIKNPHLISPNNSIRFLLGDESEPPAFTVTENASDDGGGAVNVDVSTSEATQTMTTEVTTNVSNDENIPAPTTGPVAGAVDEQEPEIPPPSRVSRPVVKKLPPSLPSWQDTARRDEYDDLGIDYGRRKILDIEDTIPLTSFVSEEPPEESGTISEIEVGHNIASAYQYIYVSMKPGQGQVGDTYLVVANRGRVQSVHPTIKGFLGYSIDIQGEVQLVERASGSNELVKGEMYRALVLRIINPVSVGATLTPGRLEKVQVSEEGPRSQVVAQIVGGSFFNRRQVYGNESITYLNRGADDGLQVGQVLPIRANRKVRNINTEVESNIRPIGWLRIVKVTAHFATAVIVRAWSDVLSGDLTGSGEMLPSIGLNGTSGEKTSESAPAAGALGDEFDADEDFNDTGVE